MAEHLKVRRERLADGRVLRITLDEPYWVCEVEGTGETVVSGGNSGRLTGAMLADLLGYDVANEEWPTWIDDLAAPSNGTCARRSDSAGFAWEEPSAGRRRGAAPPASKRQRQSAN